MGWPPMNADERGLRTNCLSASIRVHPQDAVTENAAGLSEWGDKLLIPRISVHPRSSAAKIVFSV
jgi:hypothetical protein